MRVNFRKSNNKRFLASVLAISMVFLFLFQVDTKKVEADEPFTPSPAPLIIEQFTGGTCGYCPITSAYLQLAKLSKYKNEEFIIAAFHRNDAMANSDTQGREVFYGINGIPVLVFDGAKSLTGYSQSGYGDMIMNHISNAISSRKKIADIYLQGYKDPKQFDIKVRANEPFGKRKINLVAIIMEDWVNVETPNAEAFHRNVVRNMPYGSTGRGIILKEGEIFSETRKFALQTKAWDQVAVLAFLQDMDSKEIVGSGYFKYNSKKPGIYYWGKELSYEKSVPVTTSKNKVEFNVSGASDLKEVFVKVRLDNSIYKLDNVELVGAEISEEMQKIATIEVKQSIGEVRVKFSEPVNGDATIFIATLRFKKKADYIPFQIMRFGAINSENQTAPLELIDLRLLLGFKVSDNPYDLDANLSIDEGDVAVLIQ
ncbi:MAG: hypothetical protein PHD83_03210, partial [Caldisericia bacterium]|nr:hypothetical protein [Caldisericia bacterium]